MPEYRRNVTPATNNVVYHPRVFIIPACFLDHNPAYPWISASI
jgi:hypothetical protein